MQYANVMKKTFQTFGRSRRNLLNRTTKITKLKRLEKDSDHSLMELEKVDTRKTTTLNLAALNRTKNGVSKISMTNMVVLRMKITLS